VETNHFKGMVSKNPAIWQGSSQNSGSIACIK